jgi:hypothetical protein
MEEWFNETEISIKTRGWMGLQSVLKRTSLKKKKLLSLNNLA